MRLFVVTSTDDVDRREKGRVEGEARGFWRAEVRLCKQELFWARDMDHSNLQSHNLKSYTNTKLPTSVFPSLESKP